MKAIFSILIVLAITVNSEFTPREFESIGKIVERICVPEVYRNPGVPEAFFRCYDVAKGQKMFSECQMKSYGNNLDNEETIEKFCRTMEKFPENSSIPLLSPWKLIPVYVNCLEAEYDLAGMDFEADVIKIIPCQSKVVGVTE